MNKIIDGAICNRNGRNGLDFHEECGSPTPLLVSCAEGNLDAVKVLVVMGAKVKYTWSANCCDNCTLEMEVWINGRDCLYLAASSGFLEMAKYMWPLYQENGGHIDDVKKFSCSGCSNLTRENISTPLHIANKNGHHKLVEFFLERGASKEVEV